jgi:AcrR family transcriptional regulator
MQLERDAGDHPKIVIVQAKSLLCETRPMKNGPPPTRAHRRVGAETSKTRHALLDAVEKLMLEQGYPGVTYRALAAKANVKPALVQYYFPTLDDIFLATVRRRVDRNVERLVAALKDRPDQPLRVMWEFNKDESTAALMIEFTAVGNRRPSIKTELGQVTEKLRQVQIDALNSTGEGHRIFSAALSPSALALLLSIIPKQLKLEASVGASKTHNQLVEALECYLDTVEPPSPVRGRRNRQVSSGGQTDE